MPKYIEVEVSKKVYSTVFLKVPDDYDIKNIRRIPNEVFEACKKTLCESDWEHGPLMRDDLDFCSCQEIDEKTYKSYDGWDVESNEVTRYERSIHR